MKIARRDFLRGVMAASGGIVLQGGLLRGAEDKPAAWDPWEIVPLGKCGLKTTRVGMGLGVHGWQRQCNLVRMGKRKAFPIIQAAYERGVRLFDAADLYGIHPWLAEAMEKVPREKYAVSTKIWINADKGLAEPERPDADVVVARFLKELKTDYIDLVQLHCQTDAQWPDKHRKQLDILDKLKQKGVIRAHGVTCHSVEALEAAAAEPWVDVVHARINHKGVAMDAPPDTVAPVLKKIHQAGKGLIGMKLVGEGKWKDQPEQREASLRFVLGLGCVDTMIIGFEQPEHVDDLVQQMRKIPRTA